MFPIGPGGMPPGMDMMAMQMAGAPMAAMPAAAAAAAPNIGLGGIPVGPSGFPTSAVHHPNDGMSAEEAAHLGSLMSSKGVKQADEKKCLRKAAGKVWNDPSLLEWPDEDYRLFCGDLGNEVTEDLLANAFRQYRSFQKCRVIRDKRTGKTKGYGFASFGDPQDMLKALKEVNNKYVGNRPIRLSRSTWKDRDVASERNKKLDDMGVGKTAENKSRTLKKFKIIKPVTGGKKEAVAPRAPFRRGHHPPGASPFHLPKILQAPRTGME
ncbi:unnamed protein product [Vitrella brassicaformis CCMP3155]|uniref:RRM domain-containing protein n=2 Tax=Vitrella brassicaformis TaxID=1169539 RepID=A0A0G4GHD7_VITBC|nr:unnamed protein product [Vitrella brassicaformis CCMP3155]|eukprot:CEM28897.1 unnamed protein product [Vitrella brassicaformis CCMP3155]